MAFADAVFDGRATLAGIDAVLVTDLAALPGVLSERAVIPVVIADWELVVRAVHPDITVDARMRKRTVPEIQRSSAPLAIGLGPGFIAGETVDLAVETGWGDDLGQVITSGPTRARSGEPCPIAGHGRNRYVYAPIPGLFATTHHIGDAVTEDEPVAWIDGTALEAPLAGVPRGLTRDGVPVARHTKLIEVDPRGARAVVTGIGKRPHGIAAGVLAALGLTAEVACLEQS